MGDKDHIQDHFLLDQDQIQDKDHIQDHFLLDQDQIRDKDHIQGNFLLDQDQILDKDRIQDHFLLDQVVLKMVLVLKDHIQRHLQDQGLSDQNQRRVGQLDQEQ